jgi:hypothetical protein
MTGLTRMGINLTYAELKGRDLSGAILSNANLTNAILTKACGTGATLTGAVEEVKRLCHNGRLRACGGREGLGREVLVICGGELRGVSRSCEMV